MILSVRWLVFIKVFSLIDIVENTPAADIYPIQCAFDMLNAHLTHRDVGVSERWRGVYKFKETFK